MPGYLTVNPAVGGSSAVVGEEYNGSKRWLSLGPVSFQPSEFAKVAVIVFLSWLIEKNIKKMGKFKSIVLTMLTILPIVGLVGASNLSTAIIILGIAGSADLYGESEISAVFLDDGAGGAGFMAIFLALESYQAGADRNLEKSGEIRKRLSDPAGTCMPSEPEACLAEDWGTVSRSWGFFLRHKMI